MIIGIRREDKSEWEKRVPIIPGHIKELNDGYGVQFCIQPSKIRIFKDKEFRKVGARLMEDLSQCDIVFAVKEIPTEFIHKDKIYVFFAHVIKGQAKNMPMLKKIIDSGCTLIDYEKIIDNEGRRLVFFGRHAGIAGMIDSLWALGKRLKWEGVSTPFAHLKQPWKYKSLEDIKSHLFDMGRVIGKKGLPAEICPLTCGFAGYGNVSKGAQEMLDILPVKEISPSELHSLVEGGNFSNKVIYKVVFYEKDMFEPRNSGDKFELHDYFNHPEKYSSIFTQYLPHLTLLMNCIYWDARYPRLVTKEYLRQMYSSFKPKLKVIGDISCDVDGAVECTMKSTNPGEPVFVWDVGDSDVKMGVEGNGPVVLAVDNLPAEIARKSSMDFSATLKTYIPAIASANYSAGFQSVDLPPEIKRAIVVYKGKLAPNYEYLSKFL